MILAEKIKAAFATFQMQLDGFAKDAYRKDIRIAKLTDALAYAIKEADGWHDECRGTPVQSSVMEHARSLLVDAQMPLPDCEEQASRIADLERQLAEASAPAVDPVAPFRNLTAWQELRADVLHGLDGLDNDQTNIVLGAIDYYMPYTDSTALQAPVREVPGWQPIETAPKDGTRIMIFMGAPWARIVTVRWFDLWENWQEGDFPEDKEKYCGIGSLVPTHWMPLPAAPVQQTTAIPASNKEQA